MNVRLKTHLKTLAVILGVPAVIIFLVAYPIVFQVGFCAAVFLFIYGMVYCAFKAKEPKPVVEKVAPPDTSPYIGGIW